MLYRPPFWLLFRLRWLYWQLYWLGYSFSFAPKGFRVWIFVFSGKKHGGQTRPLFIPHYLSENSCKWVLNQVKELWVFRAWDWASTWAFPFLCTFAKGRLRLVATWGTTAVLIASTVEGNNSMNLRKTLKKQLFGNSPKYTVENLSNTQKITQSSRQSTQPLRN